MTIKNVTCYGTGLIGSAWVTNFLMAGGLNITAYDLDQDKLDAARASILSQLGFLVEEGIMTQEERDARIGSVHFTTDPQEALRDADFIQENGPENLALKQEIIANIEKYCRPDAIIASSTSGLLISDISAKAAHPERIVGGHPYNPVHLIPLVEMTKCDKTDPEVLQTVYDFYKTLKKEPVILQKEAKGFICNRLQVAILREATDLVNRGVCSIDEVDRALCYGPGLRFALMGPHAIFQLTGGAYGIAGALKHIGVAMPAWLEDMASWTEFPGIYQDPALIQKMTNEALALRTEEQGRDTAGLMRFRDKGLVTLLKYHGKL